jgi:hypothetical protein
MYRAAVVQNKTEVDLTVSDAGLIALVCRAREEIDARDRVSEANVLLHDFAGE